MIEIEGRKFSFGGVADPDEHRANGQRLDLPAVSGAPVLQDRLWYRDQLENPTCTWQGIAGVVEAQTGRRVSAMQGWGDARRWAGFPAGSSGGVSLVHGILSLLHRGAADYVEGEDARPAVTPAPDRGAPSLASELSCVTFPRAQDLRIDTGGDRRLQDILSALHGGFGVLITAAVSYKLCTAQPTDIVGVDTVGCPGGAMHTFRILGWDGANWVPANSWGGAGEPLLRDECLVSPFVTDIHALKL